MSNLVTYHVYDADGHHDPVKVIARPSYFYDLKAVAEGVVEDWRNESYGELEGPVDVIVNGEFFRVEIETRYSYSACKITPSEEQLKAWDANKPKGGAR